MVSVNPSIFLNIILLFFNSSTTWHIPIISFVGSVSYTITYEQFFIYDKENKILITCASQNTIDRLTKRKDINHVHYMDALLLYNENIEAPKQLTMIEMDGDLIEERYALQDHIKKLINKEIRYHMLVVYNIAYRAYSLVDVKCVILSPDYVVIEKQDWAEFINPDYNSVLTEQWTNVAPQVQNDRPYIKQKEVEVKLKLSR